MEPKDENALDGAADLENLDSSPESLDEVVVEDTAEAPEVQEEPEERLIPKSRLDEVIAQRKVAEDAAAIAERARQVAEARAVALEAKQKPKITRDALRNAVEQGIISQAQSDDAWDEELIRRAKDEAKKEGRAESAAATRVAKVDLEIGRFRALIPAVADRYSPERKLLETAYADVVYRLGPPQNKAQELAYEVTALRETFGGIDNLEKTHKTPLKPSRFAQREVGGGRVQANETDVIAKLDNRQKRYYSKMIDRHVYKDWNDVREELSWKRGAVKK